MKKTLFVFSMLICGLPTMAYVYGGTNLGYLGYPEPNCHLYDYSNNYERQSYVKCINEYVENASNDIKRIKEKAEEATYEAKRKLNYGY